MELCLCYLLIIGAAFLFGIFLLFLVCCCLIGSTHDIDLD